MVTIAEAMGISVQRQEEISEIMKNIDSNIETISGILENLADRNDLTKKERIYAIFWYGSICS